MKFSVTVEFGHFEDLREPPNIVAGSEQARLSQDIFGLTAGSVVQPTTIARSLQGFASENASEKFARLLMLMAAYEKLTELRILHSILVTYPSFLSEVRIETCDDICRMVDMYRIQVELSEHHMIVDAELDGRTVQKRIRRIDLMESPNRDGDVVQRDEANMPKRRMRIRTNS